MTDENICNINDITTSGNDHISQVQVETNSSSTNITSDDTENCIESCEAGHSNSQTNADINETEDKIKTKNARKKEMFKKMLQSNIEVNRTQYQTLPQQSMTMVRLNNEGFNNGIIYNQTQIYSLFQNHIGPLYAPYNAMNNILYYPSGQYLHNRPQINMVQNMNIPNHIPNHQPYGNPQYFNNLMQHPLSFRNLQVPSMVNTINNPCNFTPLINQQNKMHLTQQIKKNEKKKKAGQGKFEPYLSSQEVEDGLKTNKLILGVFRINPKRYLNSYVTCNKDEQDIFIDGTCNRNRAFDGDVVVIKLLEEDEIVKINDKCEKVQKQTNNVHEKNKLKQEETCPDINTSEYILNMQNVCKQHSLENNEKPLFNKQGKVVYIKEKVHPRVCVGNLKLMSDKNRAMAHFYPRDSRIPLINVPHTSWPNDFYQKPEEYANTLFLVKILEWYDTRFAIGVIDSIIGKSGELKAERKAILAQNNLKVTPFESSLKELYPGLDYTISKEEIELREDCRKLCIFAIDPHNCRDIDDAISCRELENGNYEIGVHIADVTHYLKEGTKLDDKVAEKATTIYLVEKAYHMLPDDLCLLCSLFPGVDKLAFSIFWEITKDAEVLSHRFSKTVINSCSQLSYEHAQDILDGKDIEDDFPTIHNGYNYDTINKTIKMLGSISSLLRKKRYDNGALKLDQPKILFKLNSLGFPVSFSVYKSKESHQLIEELMLLANSTVAQRINDDHPNLAFLRCHPPPNGYMLQELAKSLQPLGINLNISSAGELYNSLKDYLNDQDSIKMEVLSMLCAKPMSRAEYFCAAFPHENGFAHYALNVPLYTHFTSPIRRYADIMVHRYLLVFL